MANSKEENYTPQFYIYKNGQFELSCCCVCEKPELHIRNSDKIQQPVCDFHATRVGWSARNYAYSRNQKKDIEILARPAFFQEKLTLVHANIQGALLFTSENGVTYIQGIIVDEQQHVIKTIFPTFLYHLLQFLTLQEFLDHRDSDVFLNYTSAWPGPWKDDPELPPFHQ